GRQHPGLHGLAIDVHHEAVDRRTIRDGKDVDPLSIPLLGVVKDLIDSGCRYLVGDGHINPMGPNLELVTDRKRLGACRITRWRIDDDDAVRACGDRRDETDDYGEERQEPGDIAT